MKLLPTYFSRYFELAVWITGLLLLACMNPAEEQTGFCFFKWIGISFCPGCGIGHSISWLFRGEIAASFKAHPFGIFALIILLHRIYVLVKKNINIITA